MKTLLLSPIFVLSALLAQAQWTYSNLSEPKLQMGVASLGNMAYFAGGNTGVYVSDVDIYDVVNGTWGWGSLSFARQFPVGVSCGSKVMFAGGARIGSNTVYNIVDIYDTLTHQWTVEHLSAPRFMLSAVSKGNKVLFAGGVDLSNMTPSSVVDIYDVQSGLWTTASLGVARCNMGAAVVGDLAIFAGGYSVPTYSKQVDIYNFSTDTWSTATLSKTRAFTAATAVGDKVLIAGGVTDPSDPASTTDRVDIFDAATNTWSTSALSVPRAFIDYAVTVGNKAYFVGGGNFSGANGAWTTSTKIIDIYNNATGLWSTDSLTHALVNHSVTVVGNHLLAAGGISMTPPIIPYSTVEIFTDPTVGIESASRQDNFIRVYPNPSSGTFYVSLPNLPVQDPVTARICNLQGQEVFNHRLQQSEQKIDLDVPSGIYFLYITSGQSSHTKLITIQ